MGHDMLTIFVIALGTWGYAAYRGWTNAVYGRIPSLPVAKALLPSGLGGI